MKSKQARYQLIERQEELDRFYRQNSRVDWMGFDTEFIGEKRFYTTLCLIQIATKNGLFLIDPIQLSSIDPLLEIISQPHVIKITHAGENDYRILYNQYDLTPRNVVDTQIAAGFVGYKYPVSFGKLVEGELGIYLNKGFTVADWEIRPLKPKQIKYALDDVLHLHDLWRSIYHKLEKRGRVDWALEECFTLENAETYDTDPDKDALRSNIIKKRPIREQVFLLRLFRWRRDKARERNHSKEMVMPSKLVNLIIRTIPGGIEAIRQHRRIPDNIYKKYGDLFSDLYREEPTREELSVLKQIPMDLIENPRQDLMTDMLDTLIKIKCLDDQISHDIVLPRQILKQMKADADYFDPLLNNSWRKKFLGPALIEWMKHRTLLELDFSNGKLQIHLPDMEED